MSARSPSLVTRHWPLLTALEVELQRELNLSRIIRVIAGGGDLGEVLGVRKVQESGQREVWMVREVEELGSELEVSLFRGLELLEE